MKLSINSSDNLKTIIRLDKKEWVTAYTSPREQNVMGALITALKQESSTIKDISSIEVTTGPGSFTGIRVGVAIAIALSFALNIPINNQPAGSSITPNYGKAPNISRSKLW